MSSQHESSFSGGEIEKAIRQVVDAIAKNQAHKAAQMQRATRYNFNIPVVLSAISASRTLKQIAVAWSMDISYDGIGFLSEYKCMPKEVVFVDFERVIGRTFQVETEILHCKTILTKTHRIGGIFRY